MNISHLFSHDAPCPKYPWKTHIVLLLPLLVAIVLIACTVGCWGGPVREYFVLMRNSYPHMNFTMEIITKYGNLSLECIYCILFIYSIIYKNKKLLIFSVCYAILCIVTMLVVVQLMKYGFGLPRPYAQWPPRPWTGNDYASFPSGHTTNIIISAISLALFFKRNALSILLSLLIACMGISRIWLGFHHPVDVLGGMVLGSVAAWLITVSASKCNTINKYNR